MTKNNKIKLCKICVSLTIPMMLISCDMQRNMNLTPRWQAEAQQTSFLIELPFSGKHLGIGINGQRQIKESIEQAEIKGKGVVYARIKYKSLISNIHDPSKDPRIMRVMKLLKKYGLPENRIEIIQDPDLKFSSLESYEQKTGLYLGIDSYRIKSFKCPGFDRQAMDRLVPPEGEAHFGCTTEENFALMIAEPRDLHHGQKLSGNDSVLSTDAIERLRTDKVKNLKIEKLETSSGPGVGG